MTAGGSSIESPLRVGQVAAWSLVSLIGTMMMVPLNALIPAFYAKNTAVTLGQIGVILLVARIYDAVADPTVGYLSDRTQSPIGRRKPWIVVGGLLAAFATALLFRPEASAGPVYFLCVILLFYTSYSMMAVPHGAWGSELSRDPAQRSALSGALSFAGVVGLLIFMGLPILLSSPLLRLFKTSEVTPPMLRLLGWLMVILAPMCVLIPAVITPRGLVKQGPHTSLKEVAASIRRNRPYLTFIGAYALTGIGYGVYYATTYLFIDRYLGMADRFPLIYAVSALAQMCAIPLLTRLAARFERAKVWALGIAAFGLLLPLRYLVPHGEAGLPAIMVLAVVLSVANAASQVPQMAVLADCVDFGTLKSGTPLAGSYYATQQFVLKAMLALGGAAAFFGLSLAHFDAKQATSSTGLPALAAIHSLVPLALFAASGAMLWQFPLTNARQEVVRRGLQRLSARQIA